MLFDPSSSNACATLGAVNLRAAAKRTQWATFDLRLTAFGITLAGCILRRHEWHSWVELPAGAGIKFTPGGRQQFQQVALAAIDAVMAIELEADR
jgi:hypothetical protein